MAIGRTRADMLQVTRTPAAMRDLVAITDWIAANNLDAARNFYNEVDRLLSLIARHPLIGEATEHLGSRVRRQSLGDYLPFYRASDDAVELIRVLHGARDIQSLQ
jgi:toxin ParE1/3/4